jgi:transposase-like protein
METPRTLLDAIRFFQDPENCRQFMVAVRWPNGIVLCPRCGSSDVSYMPNAKQYHCKAKHTMSKFSLKVGTIFEDSPIGLDKWLPAAWLISNCKNGISSYEVARALGVTQKSAWFMLHRIRLAMQNNSLMKLGGDGGAVEADETFIGGKARNMHKHIRARKITANGVKDKTAVIGVLERGGQVRTMVINGRKKPVIQAAVRQHVAAGSALYTDALRSYEGLTEFEHKVIDHAVAYADGHVHTNGLENFWSLLKRGLHGTYVSVEPFHLFRYLDEQAFRYNNREDMTDGSRFVKVLSQIVGKRITYAELTGKGLESYA